MRFETVWLDEPRLRPGVKRGRMGRRELLRRGLLSEPASEGPPPVSDAQSDAQIAEPEQQVR